MRFLTAFIYFSIALFTYNRFQLLNQYLIEYTKEYNADVFAYNEICRNLIKINELGKNANFCKNIDVRIANGPISRSISKVFTESLNFDVFSPLINNSNFLIFFSLLCVFLYIIAKFVPLFSYFFREKEQDYKLINYQYDWNALNKVPKFIVSTDTDFVPALQKIKYC